MDLVGKARRVRIYVNEGDIVQHKPAHLAILEYLRLQNTAGATVMRAIEGFGGSGKVHTTHVVDADWKLPVVIEWVDSREQVDRLLPGLKKLVVRGLITVDDTEVVLFTPLPVRDLPGTLTAGDVMVEETITTGPDALVHDVVKDLLAREPQGAIVVVEGGLPIGIITSSDITTRGGLTARATLLPLLEAPELKQELTKLEASQLTAREIMTSSPVTVRMQTPLPEVALLMARRRLQRLPVIDDQGRLVGLVRRLDVLRAVGGRFDPGQPAAGVAELAADTPLSHVARTDVPVVFAETPLAVVMQAVIATRLNCAIVVDPDRRPVGIVTDAEVLERVTPALRPNALRALMHRLPFVHPDPKTLTTAQHARARTAADLMSTELPTLPSDASLATAIAGTLRDRRRVVAIVDSEGKLVGVVDHADILRGLVDGGEEPATG